jgi:flagellar operon protein
MAEAIQGLGAPGTQPVGVPLRRTAQPTEAFGTLLDRERAAGAPVAFSGHASRRLEQRGVEFGDEQMRRLQSAVERAEAKGSRDSLILLDDLALVVSIQNHTVVTAVDEASQKEHVFTNIDSVVIAE